MILVLVGKSSSGKDTLMKELVNYNYQGVISTTSRPIREKETSNVDYYFVTLDEFLSKIENKDFIEYRNYNTKLNGNDEIWYYGTEKQSINISSDSVLVLDVKGLRDIKKYFPEETIIGVYLHCPLKLRTERAKIRGSFCEVEWNRRIQTDKVDFENVYEEVDYVLNGTNTVQELVDEVRDILKDRNDYK